MDHFLADMPLFHPASAAGIAVPAEEAGGFADDPADADIIDQIKDLIETRVRPAVANDGGDIIYRGFDNGQIGRASCRERVCKSVRLSVVTVYLKKKNKVKQ